MKQGDIWYADLDPVIGNEQAGKRLVLIISGIAINNYTNLVMICPINSKIKYREGSVFLKKNSENNLKHDSEILVVQFRTISKLRMFNKIGIVKDEIIEEVKTNINYFLNF
ncbi:MAG: type II toxin-antitoxin system PemK/MazF family toxin [Saprospiraceae bacterium]